MSTSQCGVHFWTNTTFLVIEEVGFAECVEGGQESNFFLAL